MNWVYKLARKVYGLKEPKGSWGYDVVIPLGYGLNKDDSLPDASIKTFAEAMKVGGARKIPLIFSNNGYLDPTQENIMKLYMIRDFSEWPSQILDAEPCTNSMTEALEIQEKIEEKKILHNIICVIADWPHARSTRRIWQKIFPNSLIIVKSIEGKWDSSHWAFLQRSELRWLFANILRHLALIFLGIEWVAKVQQPVR